MENDLISRQAAIDALEREKTYCTAYKDGYTQTDYFKQYNMGLTDGIKALKKLPSAEPEIIRCDECQHLHDNDCPAVGWGRNDNDYCAWAERDLPSANLDADAVARDTKAIIELCSIQFKHALFYVHLLAIMDEWKYDVEQEGET